MAENWDVVENTIEIGDGEVGIFQWRKGAIL